MPPTINNAAQFSHIEVSLLNRTYAKAIQQGEFAQAVLGYDKKIQRSWAFLRKSC